MNKLVIEVDLDEARDVPEVLRAYIKFVEYRNTKHEPIAPWHYFVQDGLVARARGEHKRKGGW
jgi:hypothetical protein